MNKLLNYLKYLGLFTIFIIVIALITSIINLIGFNSTLINKLSVILTATTFFVISTLASKNSLQKGYLIGFKLSLIFVLFFVLINFIIFKSSFTIDRIIYYTILIASSILGGSFGKNLKKK